MNSVNLYAQPAGVFNESLAVTSNQDVDSTHGGLPAALQRLLALMGLIALSPFFLFVYLLIKTESRGPAIYRQVRVGLNGRRFHFYKFRSMYLPTDPRYVDPSSLESDRDGVCKKYRNDPRITRIGRIIRKLSIDELPQLYNVVKGDMVLVGPRPALCCETDVYDQKAMQRLNVEPGITGLWQVSGRADTTFEEQVELDIRYIKERNWLSDFVILASTVPAVITGKGAY